MASVACVTLTFCSAQPYRTPIQYVAPEYESSFSSEESEPFLDAREVDDSTAPDTISENINYYEARAGDREHGNASFHDLDDSIVRDFAPSPLKVNRGVAMLEESIELGVPDVITQV